MKKQIILLGAVVLVTVSAWALLTITPAKKSAATSPKCSKTCQEKPAPNNAPQTGFFIFDSFSGTL
jgi:peptidoglycan hydrolase CwlO-like protein